MKRTVGIRGKITEMAEGTVLGHIGQDRLTAIRDRDERPMFIALDVGHEGVSRGAVDYGANRVKRWSERVIRQLGSKLNDGSPRLFEGHAKKAGEQRQHVGVILSGFSEPSTDQLMHSYAVGYVEPGKTRDRIHAGELDTCSIEAEVLFSVEGETWDVESVEDVEGVALADSRHEKPGFEKAGVVAIIQELEKGDTMDRDAVIKAVREMGLLALFTPEDLRGMIPKQPSEIFGEDRLRADPVVQSIRQQAASEEITARVKAEQRAEAAVKEAASLRGEANKSRAGRMAADLLKDDKDLSQAERQRIVGVLDGRTFAGSSEEELKAEVQTAVKAERENLLELRKLYGADKPTDDDDKADGDGGAPTDATEGDGKKKAATGDDFLDANDLTKDGEPAPARKEAA